eukprot:1210416-Rhodomonas_salina.1
MTVCRSSLSSSSLSLSSSSCDGGGGDGDGDDYQRSVSEPDGLHHHHHPPPPRHPALEPVDNAKTQLRMRWMSNDGRDGDTCRGEVAWTSAGIRLKHRQVRRRCDVADNGVELMGMAAF